MVQLGLFVSRNEQFLREIRQFCVEPMFFDPNPQANFLVFDVLLETEAVEYSELYIL